MNINIIILGASGDLSKKKILPACIELVKSYRNDIKMIENNTKILIHPWSRKEFIDLTIFKDLESMNALGEIIVGDYNDTEILENILISNIDSKNIFYLSIPPIANFNFIEMISKINSRNFEIIIEKPYTSNQIELNKIINLMIKHNLQDSINFLDHYLFKDTYQFTPSVKLFLDGTVNTNDKDTISINKKDHTGNNKITNFKLQNTIKTINIQILESIDIANRIEYYDQNGCIRDMFFHLYSLLIGISKELNFDLNLEILNITKGQYKPYSNQIKKESKTETAFQVTFRSNSTIITLSSGKLMSEKLTTVNLTYANSEQLAWNIHPLGNIEYSSTETSSSINILNNRSDHYNIFNSIINNKKDNFLKPEDVLKGWKILDEMLDLPAIIIIY